MISEAFLATLVSWRSKRGGSQTRHRQCALHGCGSDANNSSAPIQPRDQKLMFRFRQNSSSMLPTIDGRRHPCQLVDGDGTPETWSEPCSRQMPLYLRFRCRSYVNKFQMGLDRSTQSRPLPFRGSAGREGLYLCSALFFRKPLGGHVHHVRQESSARLSEPCKPVNGAQRSKRTRIGDSISTGRNAEPVDPAITRREFAGYNCRYYRWPGRVTPGEPIA